jgi:hypothetical protein
MENRFTRSVSIKFNFKNRSFVNSTCGVKQEMKSCRLKLPVILLFLSPLMPGSFKQFPMLVFSHFLSSFFYDGSQRIFLVFIVLLWPNKETLFH